MGIFVQHQWIVLTSLLVNSFGALWASFPSSAQGKQAPGQIEVH